MPGTAKSVAKKLNLRKHRKYKLYKPEYNIKLGTYYFRDMLEQSNHQVVLAAASYNAGKHRVKKWLPEKTMEADSWVETIPFKETREYVSAILAYTAIYQYRLSQPVQRLSEYMKQIQHPEIEL